MDIFEKISGSLDSINKFFTRIGEILSNPSGELGKFLTKFFTECLGTISIVSLDILVVVGLISLILYVFGWEKGKSVGFMCPAIYMILQIVAKVICHV